MEVNGNKICVYCRGLLERMPKCRACGGCGFEFMVNPITIQIDRTIPAIWAGEHRPCKKCKKPIGIARMKADLRRRIPFDFNERRTDHSDTCAKHKGNR